MKEMRDDTGGRLEITRLALGYEGRGGQAAFALALDMSPQRWNNYEKGREGLPMPVALLLCGRFGLDLDWLYRGMKDGLPSHLRRKIDELEAQDPPQPAKPAKRPHR